MTQRWRKHYFCPLEAEIFTNVVVFTNKEQNYRGYESIETAINPNIKIVTLRILGNTKQQLSLVLDFKYSKYLCFQRLHCMTLKRIPNVAKKAKDTDALGSKFLEPGARH